MEKQSIGIIGGGSWATALVKIFSQQTELPINWWVRNEEVALHIENYGHNPNYLSSVQFKKRRINVSSSIQEVIKKSSHLVFAVPAAFLQKSMAGVTNKELEHKFVICAIKGVVPEKNLIPGHFFQKEFSIPQSSIGVITGPCHAEEVALEKLSFLTIASSNQLLSKQITEWMNGRYIRTVISTDTDGAEYAGILKNIYAVCSGIFHGLGYGDNFQAVFITNAIREMEKFLAKTSSVYHDVKQSAYLGDLLVTAYSQFSRNRTFGNMIGKGYSVKSAQVEMNMIAEGYYACKSIYQMNQNFGAELPIVDAVYRVLYERMSPAIEMKLLSTKLS
jgi:glycerol-3-phosphate dehydrogenase (NAD(P)+)